MNIPKLRFPEFKSEWEKKMLGEVTLSSAFGPRFSSDLYSHSGNVLTLRTTDMNQDGAINYNHAPRAVVNIDQLKEHILIENDLVISRSGTIGITGIFEGYQIPVIPGAFLIRFRLDTNRISSKFLQLYLNSQKGRNKLDALAAGGVQKNLTGTSILKMETKLPPIAEQQKIASFLSTVDKRLQSLKNKKNLLEQYKKGVMQKLFLQELRFKDENGKEFPKWEEKMFGECFASLPSKKHQIKTTEFQFEGKYKVIDQGQDTIAGYSDDESLLFTNIPIIVFGDHTTILKYIDFDFIVGADGTKLLKSKKDSDLKYLFYNLSFNNVKQDGYKRHFTSLNGIKMQIPSQQEQTKIASFLSVIDEKINRTENQIQKTQEWKKGLLQRMFV